MIETMMESVRARVGAVLCSNTLIHSNTTEKYVFLSPKTHFQCLRLHGDFFDLAQELLAYVFSNLYSNCWLIFGKL